MKKRINKKVFYLLLSLLFLILIGFLFVNSTLKEKNPQNSITYIIQARLANSSFDYEKADSFYKQAYKADPYNINLLEEYLLFSIMQRDFKQSFYLAQKVILKNHKHFLANLVILAEDIKSNGIDSATNNLLSSGVEKDSLTDIILSSLKSYKAIKNNDVKSFEDINVLTKTLAPDFYLYEKGLLNLLNKKYPEAKQDFFKLNNTYVNIDSIIYYSQLLYQEGNQDKAVDYFSDYLNDNFFTKQKMLEYVQTPIEINDISVISDLIFRISKMMSPDINLIYLYSDSIAVANIALMIDPNNIPAQVEVASFYKTIGNYQQALDIFTKIPKSSYYSRILSQDIIEMYKNKEDNKEVINYILSKISEDPNNARLFVELGLIYHKNKEYNLAIDNYTKALSISEENNYKLGKWLAYFFRGISYDKSGDWTNAEKDMLEAKKINPSDPLLINYLAYSWINRDKNIKESMEMLKKAMNDIPNNPNILDSYAWGLFKSKKYQEALEYSQKANAIASYDPILVNHLGDILWQIGYKKEAITNWNKALNLSPEEDLSLELSNKLNGNFPKYLNKNVKEKKDYNSIIEKNTL